MRGKARRPRQRARNPEIVSVIGFCDGLGIPYTRPSEYQIKVGDLSFYPTTGTITRDNQGRLPVSGSAAFIETLQKSFWVETP